MISFSWDSKKNEANKKKHGISFDEAKTVFYDETAIRYFDPYHSDDEDRFLMVGLSRKLRILIVCHCFRERLGHKDYLSQKSHQGRRRDLLERTNMRKEYDFSKMKGQKNPYMKELKTQVTIRLDKETIDYFKDLAKKTGMSYQNLINLYLRDCVETKKEPILQWSHPA